MLKGLALRQCFLLANILLIIFVGAALAVTLSEYLAPSLELGPVSSPTIHARQDSAFAEVRDIDGYGLIIRNGLFGKAALYDPSKKKPKKVPPPKTVSQETKLPLQLLGTQVSGDDDLFAMAIIELKEGGIKTKAFYLGQEVITSVFLLGVRRREVILDNQRNSRHETLTLNNTEARKQPRPISRISSAQRGPRTSAMSRPQTINLNRAEITSKLEQEYARLASTLDIQVVKDAQGRTQGITTDNIESISVANELGFKNGDVLTSINNEPVDSREKGAEIVNKYRNASIFRIGILRDGQSIYINYRVR